MRIDCSLHEIGDGHPWNLHRILERKEDTRPCTFLRRHREKVLTHELDGTCSHGELRLSRQHCRKSTLSGTVRTHDRMDFTLADGQVNTLENLLILN